MADERDPEVPQQVSRRYRELPGEEPPRELDQAILAAAHRAADKPHAPLVTPAGRHRWYFAIGAAAVLVLAVAVTVQVERQQPDAETMVAPRIPAASDRVDDVRREQQGPAAAPPREAPAAAERLRRDRERSAVAIEERKQQNEAPAEPVSPPAAKADATVAPQASPAPPMPAEQPAQRQERSAASGTLSRDTTRAQAGSPAPAARAPQAFAVREPPERWLERIVQLRKEGRHEEADKQLAEFRRQYPDYKVPETASKRE